MLVRRTDEEEEMDALMHMLKRLRAMPRSSRGANSETAVVTDACMMPVPYPMTILDPSHVCQSLAMTSSMTPCERGGGERGVGGEEGSAETVR